MPESAIIATTIIALALIIGMSLNSIVDKVMSGRRQRHALPDEGAAGPVVREIAERQQQIEDRLRVLERIATDRGNLLADEIEALRRETKAIEVTAS